MKLLSSRQQADIQDAYRAKLAMVVPVLEATLCSLAHPRIERLGGLDAVTLQDLAREVREGHGDAGICFEYAVHQALAKQSSFIWPLASEVLEKFCKIRGGAQSILFGPEKDGIIPILESVQDALTDDSVVLVGNQGRPPKLRRYIPQIINAYYRNEERNKLPRCISGIWKADLFIGHQTPDHWVGTTVKINSTHLQGARGLRIGIYPKVNDRDRPRLDDSLNLVRLPLPYDGSFMEMFYKAFNLVRAFLRADARVPAPEHLPDAEDRLLCRELTARRAFEVRRILPVLEDMSQEGLIDAGQVTDVPVNATISRSSGLDRAPVHVPSSNTITLAPDTDATQIGQGARTQRQPSRARRTRHVETASLNPKEAAVFEIIAAAPAPMHLQSIASACFSGEPEPKAYSWARNSIRKLVKRKWIEKVGRGTYAITRAGLRSGDIAAQQNAPADAAKRRG